MKELNIHRLNRSSSTSGSGTPTKVVTFNPLAATASGGQIPVTGEDAEGEAVVGTDSGEQPPMSEESEDKFHTPPNQHNPQPRKSNGQCVCVDGRVYTFVVIVTQTLHIIDCEFEQRHFK